MRIYSFGEECYYESSDFFNKDCSLGNLEKCVKTIIRKFEKRKLFRELLETYGQKHDLRGHVLLHAHAINDIEQWMFCDNKKRYNVQKWVDQMDGYRLSILLNCCNPENHKIHSKKSIVIHPCDCINFLDLIRGCHLRIYVPEKGYLDNNYYRLRKTINELK